MFYGLNNIIKKILPKGLFYRSLIIVATPIIILQIISNLKDIDVSEMTPLEALIKLNCNVFWHQNDSVTMTNHGYIWCYPGIHANLPKAIWLDLHDKPLPEKIDNIYGICSDVYKEKYF